MQYHNHPRTSHAIAAGLSCGNVNKKNTEMHVNNCYIFPLPLSLKSIK
jgi:hypothetical protein